MTRTASQRGRTNRLAGAKAERDARKWLIGLGFNVSQRQSQYRSGVTDGNELIVEGVLAVEVKRHKDIGLGTKKLADACEQAKRDANPTYIKLTVSNGNTALDLDSNGVIKTVSVHPPEVTHVSNPWCVVWRPTGGRQHFITYHNEQGHRVTLDSDDAAKEWIASVVKSKATAQRTRSLDDLQRASS